MVLQITSGCSRSAESRPKGGEGVSRPFTAYRFQCLPGKAAQRPLREMACYLVDHEARPSSRTHLFRPTIPSLPQPPGTTPAGARGSALSFPTPSCPNPPARDGRTAADSSQRPTAFVSSTFRPPRVLPSSVLMLPMPPAVAAQRPTLDQRKTAGPDADRASTCSVGCTEPHRIR